MGYLAPRIDTRGDLAERGRNENLQSVTSPSPTQINTGGDGGARCRLSIQATLAGFTLSPVGIEPTSPDW